MPVGCGGGAGAGWGDVSHLWKERDFGCVLLPSAGHVNTRLDSFQTWRIWRALLAQTVNLSQKSQNLSTMRETWVRPLGREEPLEKEMAIHSSPIAWKIPWTDEPGRLQSMGSQRVGHD